MMEKILVHKKAVVGIAAFLAVALTAGFIAAPGGSNSSKNAASDAAIRTVTLSKGNLSSTVSSTGTVYSMNLTNVYSTLKYPVKTIFVEEGDKVNAGDILAVLDMEDLESEIQQKQASLSSSQKSAQQNLSEANRELTTYESNISNNYDSTILNAESGFATAVLDLENAERDVKNAELDVQNAELEVQSANNNLYIANRDRRQAEKDGEEDSVIQDYKDKVRSAETAVDKAATSLEKSKSNLEKVKTTLEKTQQALEKAQVTLDAARAGIDNNIATYQGKVKSAQLGTEFKEQNLTIQNLQSDLEKRNIIAPVSGTITLVNAVETASGEDLLFVIQNTDDLKVITNIKEYDVDTVKIGDKVIITTDATGDTEFTGKLEKIAPTSTLTTKGEANSSTDAEYKSEVVVTSKNDGLKIGMNARLRIVTEEKRDVFYVPYEAVETNGSKSVIYVQNAGDGGTTSIEMLEVQTGMETNLYVEISGDRLTDGMQVVKNAATLDKSLVTGMESADLANGEGVNSARSSGGQGNRQGGFGGIMPGGGPVVRPG